MTEPTEAQIKEFWKWCGFTFIMNYDDPTVIEESLSPIGERIFPPIDHNSLFQFAVPIVIKSYEDRGIHTAEAWRQLFAQLLNRMAEDIGKDPVSALYWALYKVMEAK